MAGKAPEETVNRRVSHIRVAGDRRRLVREQNLTKNRELSEMFTLAVRL
jgi:hypothetical protein